MLKRLLNRWALAGVTSLVGAIAAAPAAAQDFPTKQPIKIVVPYPPGGGTDVMARITAEYLQARLGQSVIVENRTGASGSIGANYVAKAPPDGYTLLYLPGGDVTAMPAVRTNVPFKYDEFTFLVRGFLSTPMVLASPKLPVSTTQELIAHMKANPGKVSFGTPGVGHIVHLAGVMFENATGLKTLTVPYSGIAPVFTAMLGGTLDFTMATPPWPEGVKVLGAAGSRRSPFFPDQPTLEEMGIKGGTWDLWFGFVAPPNLPKPIADRLTAELLAVLKNPEAIAKYKATLNLPDPNPLTGDAFKSRVQQEYNTWRAIVVREKIVVE
jgi:tripartite-type tricarboxylate transporter receptor subunit TctC